MRLEEAPGQGEVCVPATARYHREKGSRMCDNSQTAASPAPRAQRREIEPTRGFDWNRLIPGFWFQCYRTDRYWDATLNLLLDNFQAERLNRHEVRIGNTVVWVSNWPHSYGENMSEPSGLPLVGTRKRLRHAVAAADANRALRSITA